MKNFTSQFKKIFHLKAGFTLVEALVAIAILSLAMTGPLVIAEKGLSSSLYAQDEVTATYLAQDAIEYVRNVRDTNVLSSNPWTTNLTNCMNGSSCQIDTTVPNNPAEAITQCPTTCPVMRLDPQIPQPPAAASMFYDYNPSATPTIFTRTVTVSSVAGNSGEVLVTATVSWKANIYTAPRSVTIAEHIFNI